MNNKSENSYNFVLELVEICKKYGLSLKINSNKDGFVVANYDESMVKLILDSLEEIEVKVPLV